MAFWLAAAGITASLIGAGVSAYGISESSAQATRNANLDAKLREQEAANAQENAAYQERQFRRKASLLQGRQAALLSMSGVDPTSGSPLLLTLDTARQTELEALNIRRGGEVSAWGSEFAAKLDKSRASYYAAQGRAGIGGAVFDASSSILSGWSKLRTPASGGIGTTNLGVQGMP